MYLRLIIGTLFLCISAHLTVLLLSNPVLNLIFLLLPITSSHSHASASDSTFDYWRYINISLTFFDIAVAKADHTAYDLRYSRRNEPIMYKRTIMSSFLHLFPKCAYTIFVYIRSTWHWQTVPVHCASCISSYLIPYSTSILFRQFVFGYVLWLKNTSYSKSV